MNTEDLYCVGTGLGAKVEGRKDATRIQMKRDDNLSGTAARQTSDPLGPGFQSTRQRAREEEVKHCTIVRVAITLMPTTDMSGRGGQSRHATREASARAHVR